MRKLIEHVLAGVVDVPTQYNVMAKEGYSIFQQKIKTPIKLSEQANRISYKEIAERLGRLFAHYVNDQAKSYFRNTDDVYETYTDISECLKIEQDTNNENLFKFKLDFYVFSKANIEGKPRHIKIEQARFSRMSVCIKWLSDTLQTAVSNKALDYIGDSRLQAMTKDVMNYIARTNKEIYLYFVNTNYVQHYLALSRTENLSSCMSYNPKTYHVLRYNSEVKQAVESNDGHRELEEGDYGDWYVHPLEGYDLSPDFALGLASTHSPEALQKMLDSDSETIEYPFIGRVVVSHNEEGELTYARYYGNEVAYGTVNASMKQANPLDSIIFGTAVYAWDRTSHVSGTVGDMFDGKEWVDDEVAISLPYVDCYCNYYEEVGDPILFNGGVRMPYRVKERSPDGYDNYYQQINVSSGIAYSIDCDEDEYDYSVELRGAYRL